jgi:hypothetical protein
MLIILRCISLLFNVNSHYKKAVIKVIMTAQHSVTPMELP